MVNLKAEPSTSGITVSKSLNKVGSYVIKNKSGEVLGEIAGEVLDDTKTLDTLVDDTDQTLEDLAKKAGVELDKVDSAIKSSSKAVKGGSNLSNYSTKIDNKVTVMDKQELPSWLGKTFKDSRLQRTVSIFDKLHLQ